MASTNSKLQKWLGIYLLLSVFLWVYLWDFNYRRRESLELILVTHLWVILVFLAETFFFYLKITQKSILWCLLRTVLGTIIGLSIAIVVLSFLKLILGSSLQAYLIEYFIIGCSMTFFNGVYMFSKANLEEHKVSRSDVLDDSI